METEPPKKDDAKARLRNHLRLLKQQGKKEPPTVQGVEPNMRTAAVLHPRLDKRA